MTIRVDLDRTGRRIEAVYAPPGLAKKVPGSNRRKSGEWTFPLTLETCDTLRKVFGPKMRVSAALGDWARDQIEHAAELDDIAQDTARLALPRVAELAPDLAKAIMTRRYQAIGAQWVTRAPHGILGDDPGLGKTLQALAALVESGAHRILVTCPKTATKTVWERETRRWAPSIYVYRAHGNRTQRQVEIDAFIRDTAADPDEQHMLIVNTEMMRICKERCPDGPLNKCENKPGKTKIAMEENPHRHQYDIAEWPELSDIRWDAIIVDESHNALAGTQSTRGHKITQVRYGAMHIRRCLRDDGLAIAMSGTPARSKLPKFWGTLNWCEPKVFTSFWNWAGEHFGADYQEGKDVAPEPVDLERFNASMRRYYLARTKAEVAPDLPPIVYAGVPSENNPEGPNAIWIDMDPRQRDCYEEMRKWARVRLENGEVEAVGVLAEMTRLRQFANSYATLDEKGSVVPAMPSAKFDWIEDFILERQESGQKVVLASSFTKLVNLFAFHTSKHYPVLSITGQTSQRNRDIYQQRFQNGSRYNIMYLNTHAGGEAITLDQADDMVVIDLPWLSDQEDQLVNRIHRVSRIHNVTVYRLLTPDSIEENMANITDTQRKVLASARPEAIEMALELI